MAQIARKAVFILPADTPAEVVGAYLDRFPRQKHIILAYDRPAEWDELDRPFDFYNVAAARHLHWNLKRIGPVDTIVAGWKGPGESHLANLATLFFHLRHGGTYIIPWFAVTRDQEVLTKRLLDTAARLTGDTSVEQGVVDREFFYAVSAIRIGRREARILKRGNHYLKLRDDEASRVLPNRSPIEVTDLVTTKAGQLKMTHPVASLGASRDVRIPPDALEYPSLHLRHYTGKIGLVSNSLVFTENSILPDSFRHHLESTPRNVRLTGVAPDFGRIRPQYMPKDELKGSYYLLDSENSGHFGHMMTEVISRLWGWDAAKAEDPDVKALFRIRYTNERDPRLERTIFEAYGIDRADIVWVDRPVWLESAFGATPQFHNQLPHYVHPGIVETWRRIRDGLPQTEAPTFDKIFVSRGANLGARRCLNREAVEESFERAGFTVIFPEHFSLPEQAEIFRRARVIAGFGGSAMFNCIFAENLEHMIVLNHESYTARNEQLIAAALDTRLSYIWNRPSLEHPKSGWSRDAYRSEWTFDFERNGGVLDDLLRDI